MFGPTPQKRHRGRRNSAVRWHHRSWSRPTGFNSNVLCCLLTQRPLRDTKDRRGSGHRLRPGLHRRAPTIVRHRQRTGGHQTPGRSRSRELQAPGILSDAPRGHDDHRAPLRSFPGFGDPRRTPTAQWPSSMDRDVWRDTTPMANRSTAKPARPRDPLRRDRPAPCGQVDSRSATDHFPTGPETATEAVNSYGT